jgi:4-hydroxy-3-methylbut-2-enyl diphosphate reductase
MKINLAKSAGFCVGVKRAIDIALKTAASEKNVYMLGDIVHNEDVVAQLCRAGIKKIKKLACGKNKTFLIRAHGMGKNALQKALRLDYKVIDATCPMVKEIHNIVQRMENDCQKIIVIGDRFHDEVRGIVGQLRNKAIVIEDSKRIPLAKVKGIKKACLVVQSTQNIDKVLEIVRILNNYIPDLKFFNTVCKPTRTKQEEIKRMPLENDVMIIIGSRNSANTKRLYEISKSLNRRSYWVSSKKDIKKEWFKAAKSVGVTAGASTPDYTTQKVIAYLKQIS